MIKFQETLNVTVWPSYNKKQKFKSVLIKIKSRCIKVKETPAHTHPFFGEWLTGSMVKHTHTIVNILY